MWMIETVIVAFSMFSALPMPQISWNEKNMRYAMCAFPLIGVVIGLAMRAWAAAAGGFHFPELVRGAGFCLIPLIVTGGIHMDGFADTWDALASHAPAEKKLQILKDPHIGAFGVIHIGMYLIADFAVWTSIDTVKVLPLVFMFSLSRSLSGLAVTRFPLAKNTGLVHTFASAADKRRAGGVLAVLAALLLRGALPVRIGRCLHGGCCVGGVRLVLPDGEKRVRGNHRGPCRLVSCDRGACDGGGVVRLLRIIGRIKYDLYNRPSLFGEAHLRKGAL